MSYAEGSMAANTPDVWRRLVGERIVATFGTHRDGGTQIWLVTESRAAFVFTRSGSFWRATAEEVAREMSAVAADLGAKITALGDVLDQFGQLRGASRGNLP
jgi:hypothetical protein